MNYGFWLSRRQRISNTKRRNAWRIVTGSDGEFIALPISSTQLEGCVLNTNGEPFILVTVLCVSSIIQALNYLSVSIGDGGGSIAFQSGSTTVNTVSNVNTSLLGLIQDQVEGR